MRREIEMKAKEAADRYRESLAGLNPDLIDRWAQRYLIGYHAHLLRKYNQWLRDGDQFSHQDKFGG